MAKKKLTESGYISKAVLSNVHVSPRKARLVVNMVRGKRVGEALENLEYCDKKTAALLRKLLLSAVANARNDSEIDVDELVVKSAWVDAGRTIPRWMPRAQGRATPIRKRHSKITVVLDEQAAGI
jgi:large subunit ribosomal protein L22